MSKHTVHWYSQRVHHDIRFVRWGDIGQPVLLFPTAGGDAEECERFHMLDALEPLLAAGRIKVYSIDSLASRAWLSDNDTVGFAAAIQNAYDEFIVREVVPAIRGDCHAGEDLSIVTAGASLGAFNALASICRHPYVFSAAICMSGSYDILRFLEGTPNEAFHHCSPLHFVPHLAEDGEHLRRLRERFVLLTYGGGRWVNPDDSWRVADVLGRRGVPNRVDPWGPEWDHDWTSWRRMLPQYLGEILPG